MADNADLEFVIRPLRITPAKEDLNFRHQMARFGDPPKSLSARYEYIIYYPSRLMELCCFLGEELIAFSIFEVGQRSIWSNLCCWSPGHLDRSLGILTVLKEMEYARSFGAQHYYMGHYYIHDPVYAYKTRFAGLEFYDWDNDEWPRLQRSRRTGNVIVPPAPQERERIRHSLDESQVLSDKQ